jgi:hypothetical protein
MSDLWLPDHVGELLCVEVKSQSDESDFHAMVAVNCAAFDWVAGKIDTGTYLDILDHYGLDPYGFLNPILETYGFECL